MALTQKHRSTIYQRLEPILGEEEAEALLSQFPSRELDEPVTKEFVRAEVGDLRSEMQTEFGKVRTEMQTEFGKVRTEMQTEFGNLRIEIAELRTEISDRARTQTAWITGALFGGLGLAAAIGTFLG